MPTKLPTTLDCFHEATQKWFDGVFDAATDAQSMSWPLIQQRKNTLLLAPTGSGKTLAAFLVAIDRILFDAVSESKGVRVLYISPLKALGVDVERNLQSPLAGVRAVAERDGQPHRVPRVGVRSGDTPAEDRRRLTREPPDILITTPESLYLMLTSRAREILATVDTVIIDEIHSLVGNKRGAHLFLSLERLELLRSKSNPNAVPLQRIGLSATQRPLDEIARLLGGCETSLHAEDPGQSRPVEIVEAGRRKSIDLRIEVPVEDMSRLSEPVQKSGPASAGPTVPSIWPLIHPRLVELVRAHRSTMIFVNSRRLAERLAQAINELAEEEIALAHHGSIAKETRSVIEDRLKRGTLPAIVATSSLELGIDMGAVDLVIQIEAPPTIASGIQRIGRANHHVGGQSSGVVFPKFRGDLLACSAAAERMQHGEVEETFYPRNPLDVLAQQIVAMVALDPMHVDVLYATVRSAAPFAELPRSSFDGILDLLSGRYPSHEFSELRPRVNWDRVSGEVSPRRGTQRLAILNAGTIPDRGLYGVFLANGEGGNGSRVGELDEEMVFETQPGDVFLLGASSWRALEITNDRVLVAPAPGEPGRMPFWRGDGPGRPLEFGQAIGKLTRTLLGESKKDATKRLANEHSLDRRAAKNLLSYLHEQAESTGEAPSDKTIVVESFLDEIGDWRVCVMSPFGARVHAPWAMAVSNAISDESARNVDMMWTDDGIVFRLPEADAPPPLEIFFPKSDQVEDIVVKQLGSTALFAARFRENAARALLLPRRMPGRRTPLWLQRRRSADLLAVASRYPSFPIMLETYRECLRDVFDVPGLKEILRRIERREISVRMEQTDSASPFASSLLFNYVGNYLYEGDAPLAERRAATLSLDHSQLRELLGDAELRELLDADAISHLAIELQRLNAEYALKDADGLHDLLLQLGDLSREEMSQRIGGDGVGSAWQNWLTELERDRRIISAKIANETRFIAAEDASRYRDVLGINVPVGLPAAFLQKFDQPLDELVGRYARTHVPFVADDIAKRWGLGIAVVKDSLKRLVSLGRLLEGEFLPGGRGREWCHPDVLKSLKRRSLAKLRKEIEPVAQHELARFVPSWHRLDRPRVGLDGLLDAIEQLQGIPLPATDLEQYILPARVKDYRPSNLDELCTAGEITWQGCGGIAAASAKIALYLTDHAPSLSMPAEVPEEIASPEMAQHIIELLRTRGAVFFDEISGHLGAFGNDVLNVLWNLVGAGVVTNDSLAPLRSLHVQSQPTRDRKRRHTGRFRSRRTSKLPGSEGRWSLFAKGQDEITNTQRQMSIAAQLVESCGVLTRELVTSRGLPGGFSSVYPILKAMEESGRVRRGYFVAGLGATQFASPGADDRLRSKRIVDDGDDAKPEIHVLAATDPANVYGSALRWPHRDMEGGLRPGRTSGARVILCNGALVGYLGKTTQHLLTFLPDAEPERSRYREALIAALVGLANNQTPVFLTQIDGGPAHRSDLSELMQSVGFVPNHEGLLLRRTRSDSDARR